jgi:NAD(P)-dependent dehydrogenase (short-subunit alcohol dehydrogenase family)
MTIAEHGAFDTLGDDADRRGEESVRGRLFLIGAKNEYIGNGCDHFKSVFSLTQRLVPMMRDGGRIVNLSSGLARFAMPNRAAYGSMKAAVESLTRYMALELAPRKIAANVVAPGAIATDFIGGVVRDNPQVNKLIAAQTALGRVGLPEEVGSVIAGLLSDEFGWVNAQRIEVAGGVSI